VSDSVKAGAPLSLRSLAIAGAILSCSIQDVDHHAVRFLSSFERRQIGTMRVQSHSRCMKVAISHHHEVPPRLPSGRCAPEPRPLKRTSEPQARRRPSGVRLASGHRSPHCRSSGRAHRRPRQTAFIRAAAWRCGARCGRAPSRPPRIASTAARRRRCERLPDRGRPPLPRASAKREPRRRRGGLPAPALRWPRRITPPRGV